MMVAHSRVVSNSIEYFRTTEALNFTLSQFTSVKITADAYNNLETTVGTQLIDPHLSSETSGSRAQISAFNGANVFGEALPIIYIQAPISILEGPFKLNELTILSLMFDNASNSELKGIFSGYAESFGLLLL